MSNLTGYNMICQKASEINLPKFCTSDLTIADKLTLLQQPENTPFLWIAWEKGTCLLNGQDVCYVKTSVCATIEYYLLNRNLARFFFFDGHTLDEITTLKKENSKITKHNTNTFQVLTELLMKKSNINKNLQHENNQHI